MADEASCAMEAAGRVTNSKLGANLRTKYCVFVCTSYPRATVTFYTKVYPTQTRLQKKMVQEKKLETK